LFQKQLNQPLQPKEDPKPRRETRERSDRDSRSERGGRNESRGGRNERGGERGAERGGERAPRKVKVNRTDVDWQTYRLEVGKEHGARPGDIVGAIANEISLDSSYIGAINLHDKHTYVQLPKGMPEKSFEQLKRVKIRRQSLEITVSDVKTVESTPTTDRPRKRQERSNRPS
jgi:ATP-dependent RNA helicase DeaD